MAYTTKRIDRKTASAVIEKIHYRKTLGVFWEGFGLYDGDVLVGVVCYGMPAAPIQKHAFKAKDFRLYELTRLVVDAGHNNCASMLIADSLKMLSEQPSAVISYADSAQGHVGIVYQATNWVYTGAVVAHDKFYVVDGVALHPMTVRDRFKITNPTLWAKENNIQMVKPSPKHRYFYFNGNKKQRKHMLDQLAYPVIGTYPKAAKTCYAVGHRCADVAA